MDLKLLMNIYITLHNFEIGKTLVYSYNPFGLSVR